MMSLHSELDYLRGLCDDIKAHASEITSYTSSLGGSDERQADKYSQSIYDLACYIIGFVDEAEPDEEDDLS